MAEELTYVVVTPYMIRKSRTGAILARLLGRTSAELIATQVFALTRAMAEAYADVVMSQQRADAGESCGRHVIRDYILQNFGPDSDGRRHRMLLLVFRGQNAFSDVAAVAGHIHISSASGETIRDTYGDLVRNEDGSIRYFEPAVLIPDCTRTAVRDLRFWMGLAEKHEALHERVCIYAEPEAVEKTLVVIKPDSWRERSSRPGAVIDMFSRTGLRIIAMKVCRMTVRQGLEFYGSVRDVLRRKLAPGIGCRAREVLEREFGLALPARLAECLSEGVGIPYAERQFDRIIEFMTGHAMGGVAEGSMDADGRVKCLALVYEGEHAVAKIREVLGPTDPTQAPGGTVRREFGADVMVNTAHASDSPASAEREIAILRLGESNLAPVVARAMRELGV
ncbi:MAG: nucleoside-diphosphate kinase [Lentisphaeria bacterium]|nr:nucleoside-diphosphate kinase [Lentisphaeria bacterium]